MPKSAFCGDPRMSSASNDQTDESGILQSWHKNAVAWTQAVRDGHIESRRLITDQSILEAVLEGRPHSVLDLGCGEGWLVRALAAQGIHAIGMDAVPELIARAEEAGGDFRVASYDDIIDGRLQLSVDTLVCNFALLGKESVERLVAYLPRMLEEGGRFIVQTVHPLIACGDQAYVDGWRQENWAGGFDAAFPAPAPWYFRTLSSWVAMFAASGWRLCEMREPIHPGSGRPASVIFILQDGTQDILL
jgi:2-polyprenyl-3-methyl-5-hydroxy-6-metoxy-1,4-benzoquinol methylase